MADDYLKDIEAKLMINDKIKKMMDKRNYLFLGMCFFVHFFFLILFSIIGIKGMIILNIISTVFYLFIFFVKKNFSESAIVASYFEIIIFSTIATIITGRQAGFLLYIVGMISVVFYLAYHHKNVRFLYQGVGVVFVLLLVMLEPMYDSVFVGSKEIIEPYSRAIYFVNLFITLSTVVVVSFLYAQEINLMTQKIIEINAELDYQASHDELTGLSNRYEMNKYLDDIANNQTKQVMVAMMDVDDFKKTNDIYGHGAGDLVLKELAKLMNMYLKEYEVARWGGEEFLVVSDCCDKQGSFEVMKEFHEAVKDLTIDYEGKRIEIYMTVGLVYGENSKNINHLIQEADNLLYIGKSNGKNQILTYDNINHYK